MQRLLVPATLANLGSGFDALGVALDLFLEVHAQIAPENRFFYQGEGQLPDSPNNLVHQGYRAGWAALGQEGPPLHIWANNPIPLARGMGSSSAALVAGAALADHFSGHRLGPEGVFRVTAAIEGHPDNVAPAIYGGFVAALAQPPLALALPWPAGLRFVLAIPAYEVPTPLARAALPSQVALADAVFNLSRSALWPAALASGRLEALREASRDRLHQEQRAHLMPGQAQAIEAAYQAGAVAAFVGGAGPTLAALCNSQQQNAVEQALTFYATPGRMMTVGIGGGYAWKEVSKPSKA